MRNGFDLYYQERASIQRDHLGKKVRKKCEKTEYFGCRISEREGIGTERETCLANNIALSLFLWCLAVSSLSLSLSFCFFLSLSASAWFRWEKEKERDEKWPRRLLYIDEKTMGANWICLDITKEPLYTILVLLLCLCLRHFSSFFYRKCYRHEGIHESHSLGGTHISVGSVFFEFLWLWSLVNGKEGDADSQECVAISKDQI